MMTESGRCCWMTAPPAPLVPGTPPLSAHSAMDLKARDGYCYMAAGGRF